MGLRLIIGSSGAGKSEKLFEKITSEAAASPDRNYLVIVPEQFTLSTQKRLVEKAEGGGIMNIDVLSFLRLAYRVLEELGIGQETALDDLGKSLIVRKVLKEHKSELVCYGGNIRKAGFVDEIKSMIAEFFQYDITPEDIDAMREAAFDKPLLYAKLSDMRVIYGAFRDFLSERYITNEEILDRLIENVSVSKLIRGSVVCFDGFTGFTPPQYRLIEGLMRNAAKVIVTVTMEPAFYGRELSDHNLFYMSYQMISRLTEIAKGAGNASDKTDSAVTGTQGGKKTGSAATGAESGIEVMLLEGSPKRFEGSEELCHIEKHLFRYPVVKLEKVPTGVFRVELPDRRSEVTDCASRIRNLTRTKGMKLSDIAVVSGSVSEYARLCEEEFERAGISCFIDENRSILGQPVVEALRALIELSVKDFDYDSTFRFFKCQVLKVDRDAIEEIENYCIAHGVRGISAWEKPWKKKYRNGLEPYEGMEETKSAILEVLRPVYDAIRDGELCVGKKLQALKAFIESVAKDGDDEVVGCILSMFEHVDGLIGDEIISNEEFADILDTGFKEAKLRRPPFSSDCVIVGDTTRTRLENVRVLFFLGLNEGLVPKPYSGGGILSDADRQLLHDKAFELAPTRREAGGRAEFYLYLTMTKPSELLFLYRHKGDSEGKETPPSYLLSRVNDILPKITSPDTSIPEICLSTDRGFSRLITELAAGERNGTQALLEDMFRTEREDLMDVVDRALSFSLSEEGMTTQTAARLYDDVIRGSITRLERYVSCAFSHFLSYGLGLRDRDRYSIDSLDIGNIYHRAVELAGCFIREDGRSWHGLSEAELAGYGLRAVKQAIGENGNGIFEDSKRNVYLAERLSRIVSRTMTVIAKQIEAGDFEPAEYERKFEYAGQYMRMTGKIDRIDICEKDGVKYARVIDYKSSGKDFNMAELYHGLQLQLGVYLDYVTDSFSAKPAGMYYYGIDDPIVEDGDDADERIVEALCLRGVSQRDNAINHLSDHGIRKGDDGVYIQYDSPYIGVSIRKGEITGKSKVASNEEYDEIFRFERNKLDELADGIRSGDASIKPYSYGNRNACSYCAFKGICRFDVKLPGAKVNRMMKMTPKEAYSAILRENRNR